MSDNPSIKAANSYGNAIGSYTGYRILCEITRKTDAACPAMWNELKLPIFYRAYIAESFPKSFQGRFWFPRIKMIGLSVFVFLKHLRNGRIRNKVRADVAVPVLWGVFKDSDSQSIAGVRRFTDDMYLYGEHFKPGQIVHIFGDWDIPEDGKVEWQAAMDEKGIPWVDRKKFGVNWRLFVMTLRVCKKVVRSASMTKECRGVSCPPIWRATIKGLYHYLLKQYEMENVDYKVELCKNDYNPGHVIATIVANQHGRKRIGVSHVSSAVDAPQLCFVHFDRYVVNSPLQEKLFGKYWDGVRLERIGKESIDSIVRERRRRDELRQNMNTLYGPRKWTVTILFPGNAERCLVDQWYKMYEGLCDFAMNTDVDARILLRFRRTTEVWDAPHMASLAHLPVIDDRFILEHDHFNTHELMVASDLIITANASFAINEALVAGIPVFTFDYTLKAKDYYGWYGKHFIMTESDHVLYELKNMTSPFWECDTDWNKIRADADYHFDGKNRERLAKVVAEMVEEVG